MVPFTMDFIPSPYQYLNTRGNLLSVSTLRSFPGTMLKVAIDFFLIYVQASQFIGHFPYSLGFLPYRKASCYFMRTVGGLRRNLHVKERRLLSQNWIGTASLIQLGNWPASSVPNPSAPVKPSDDYSSNTWMHIYRNTNHPEHAETKPLLTPNYSSGPVVHVQSLQLLRLPSIWRFCQEPPLLTFFQFLNLKRTNKCLLGESKRRFGIGAWWCARQWVVSYKSNHEINIGIPFDIWLINLLWLHQSRVHWYYRGDPEENRKQEPKGT